MALFKRRLSIESFQKQPGFMNELNGADYDKLLEKVNSAGINEEKYQEWKRKFLSNAYEELRDENFKTCHYMVAGMGAYSVTVPDCEVPSVKNYVDNGIGGGFWTGVDNATEEEAKNAIGKICEQFTN